MTEPGDRPGKGAAQGTLPVTLDLRPDLPHPDCTVPPARLERATPGLGILCSIHLSYEGGRPGTRSPETP